MRFYFPVYSCTYKALRFFLLFFRFLSDFGCQFGKAATIDAISTNSFFVINRKSLMFTFIIINGSFCQYNCFGDNDNSRMWKQYCDYYSGMKMCDLCYKGFVPNYSPYPAFRLTLSLLLVFFQSWLCTWYRFSATGQLCFQGQRFCVLRIYLFIC